jgi:hypothetical protein
VSPDFYGVFSGNYHGPVDITQFYFYAGILLVPLAIFGLRDRRLRIMRASADRPHHLVCAWDNPRDSICWWRSPAWLQQHSRPGEHLVCAVARSGAAGRGGIGRAHSSKWPIHWLPAVLAGFFCADLFYHQSATNPLAYSRQSYDELYGSKEELFRQAVVNGLPPLTRFDGIELLPVSDHVPFSGSTDRGHLWLRTVEAFALRRLCLRDAFEPALAQGSQRQPLAGRPHRRYTHAADPLPRANFPKELIPVKTKKRAGSGWLHLDPTRQALVPAGIQRRRRMPRANRRRARVHSRPLSYPLPMRDAESAARGQCVFSWLDRETAKTGAQDLPVLPVDHALIGVVVPAGKAIWCWITIPLISCLPLG